MKFFNQKIDIAREFERDCLCFQAFCILYARFSYLMAFLNVYSIYSEDGKTFAEAQLPLKLHAANITLEYINIKCKFPRVINGYFVTFFLSFSWKPHKIKTGTNQSYVE